jgi:hypothetical protein
MTVTLRDASTYACDIYMSMYVCDAGVYVCMRGMLVYVRMYVCMQVCDARTYANM